MAARPSCNVILDRADCDGRKTVFGLGRDWIAAEPVKEAKQTGDLGLQWGWDYGDEFEYIPDPVMAIAPKGRWSRQPPDMELSNSFVFDPVRLEEWQALANEVFAEWHEGFQDCLEEHSEPCEPGSTERCIFRGDYEACEKEFPYFNEKLVSQEVARRFAKRYPEDLGSLQVAPYSHSLGDKHWVRERGLWNVARITGKGQPPAFWIQFFDGRPNLGKDGWGRVRSNYDINPCFIVRFWNMPPHPDEADPIRNGIQFLGQGKGHSYMLRFPAGRAGEEEGDQQDYPVLVQAAWDEDEYDGVSVKELTRFEGWGSQPTEGEATLDVYVVEYTINGWLLVRRIVNGKEDEGRWAWRPPGWQPFTRNKEGEVVLQSWLKPGPIRIWCLGHKMAFNLEELTYPRYPGVPKEYRDCLVDTRAKHPSWSDEEIKEHCQAAYEEKHGHSVWDDYGLFPKGVVSVPPLIHRPPKYRRIASPLPYDPYSPDRYGPSITVKADEIKENVHRPRVIFEGVADQKQRALLYNVQEYRPAHIEAAVSEPVQTQGNPQLKVMEASGSVSSRWRGATCQVTLRAEHGETLPAIKSNQKVKVQVKVDDDQGLVTQFVGYIVPQREKGGGVGPVVATINCADAPEARLRKHKSWWHCSYEGWPVCNDVYPYPNPFQTGATEGHGWP